MKRADAEFYFGQQFLQYLWTTMMSSRSSKACTVASLKQPSQDGTILYGFCLISLVWIGLDKLGPYFSAFEFF